MRRCKWENCKPIAGMRWKLPFTVDTFKPLVWWPRLGEVFSQGRRTS